ncbi:MAG TPA: kelch repeat-containing protein, partial [Nitrospiraceae bacterium]|nr:kelch repeat-containing protein [Nitrospiraceae bacterium]
GRLNGDYQRNLSVTEVYDPVADRWARAADLPTARSGITSSVVGGRVYVFGGEGGDGTFRENEAYDPVRDTWQTMAPMPTGRHGLGSAVVRGRIYVISGGPTPGGSFSNLNEVFMPPESATSKPSVLPQQDKGRR